MPYPKLMKYSGVTSRIIEAVSTIADKRVEAEAAALLKPHGFTLRRFAKYGYKTVFCICEIGSESGEPPEGTEFFDRETIQEFIRRVKSHEHNLSAFLREPEE